MKRCSKCNIEKDYIFFSKRKASKDGLSYLCKECKSKIDKEYSINNKEQKSNYLKEYYSNNKEMILERSKEYYSNNKEVILERSKEYYSNNKENIIESSKSYYNNNRDEILVKRKEEYNQNKDKYKKKAKNWCENNHDKVKEYRKFYYKKNIEKIKEYKKNYYLYNKEYMRNYMRDYWSNKKYIQSWRSILYRSLKYFSLGKIGNTLSLLRYTPEMLKMRMECQFKDGMSWDNYGKWEIDHKKPLSKFDVNTKPHIVNALCNLQPMWKIDNIKKSNKWK